MKMIISPISIDLGAVSTGVQNTHGYISVTGDLEITDNTGVCIHFDSKKIQLLQKNRTATRHRLRGLQRRKLAKRLLACICFGQGVVPADHEIALRLAYGLLNRRGYTYEMKNLHKEDFRQPEISRLLFQILGLEPGEFSNFAEYLLENTSEFSEEKLSQWIEDLEQNKKEYSQRFQGELEDSTASSLLDKVRQYFEGLLEAKHEGAKHRKIYLKNMKDDLFAALKGEFDQKGRGSNDYHLAAKLRRLLQQLNLSKEEFYCLLGNIGNLQLRTLRKYFHSKDFQHRQLLWKKELLHKLVTNSIVSWHCQTETDRSRQKELCTSLAGQPIFSWLCTVEPQKTIPPFEDQNNRRPPKCATLYLNPQGLDQALPSWEQITEQLLVADQNKDQSDRLQLGEFSKPKGTKTLLKVAESSFDQKLKNDLPQSKVLLERLQKARSLQRILDTSMELDPYQLRGLCKENLPPAKRPSDEQLLAALHHNYAACEDFITFARRYYKEADLAKRGMWREPQDISQAQTNLFYQCGNNPPQKKKLGHIFINNLLGTHLPNKEAVDTFCCEFWRKESVGRNRFKGFAEGVEKLRKSYGNHFVSSFAYAYGMFPKYEESSLKDMEMTKLLRIICNENTQNYFAQLSGYLQEKGWLEQCSSIGEAQQQPDVWQHRKQLFILAQLYNILEADISGFSKDCQWCAAESGWRMHTQRIASPGSGDSTDEVAREVARASRLIKNSVRPFDGFLGRYLERIAEQVVQLKLEQLQQAEIEQDQVYVPILIEQNRFEFEEGLRQTKKAQGAELKKAKWSQKESENKQTARLMTKEQRIVDACGGLCPYCGKSLGDSSGDRDIDHIVPRSWSMKHYKTVFNSEANLIYTHSNCNRFGKSDAVYSLQNLAAQYLQKQFGTADIPDIEKKIRICVGPFIGDKGKNKFINFVSLTEEQQKCFRHALFVPELRKELLHLLNQRTKTMVNGTQGYLAKLIRQKLQAAKQLSGKQVHCYPFQLPVIDDYYMEAKVLENKPDQAEKRRELLWQSASVQASRALLSMEDCKYAKQQKQQPSSHVIDAAMVWATVLRNKNLLRSVLAQVDWQDPKQLDSIAQCISENYGKKELAHVLPQPLEDTTQELTKRNITDGKHLWEKSVFKDTIYGESFHPLVVREDGTLYYGFIDPQTEKEFLTPLKIAKADSYEQIFTAIAPFLRWRKRELKHSYAEYLGKANKVQKPLFFTVHKQSYFAFCEDVFYSRNNHDVRNISAEDRRILKTLESLRYVFARESDKEKSGKAQYFNFAKEQQAMLVQDLTERCHTEAERQTEVYRELIGYIREHCLHEKEKFDPEEWDFLKTKKADLCFGGIFKGKNALKPMEELEKIISNVEQAQKKQKYPSSLVKKIDQQRLLERRQLGRQHRRMPTKISVKLPASPSGTLLRIRRKDMQGNPVYQAMVGGDNEISFSIEKGTCQGSKVLLGELSKDGNITPCDLLGTKNSKWLPYNTGMDINVEPRNINPYELRNKPDGIKKIICNPKAKKVAQWILELYFTEDNFRKFRQKVCVEADDKDEVAWSFQSNEAVFLPYFGKEYPPKKKYKPKAPEFRLDEVQAEGDMKDSHDQEAATCVGKPIKVTVKRDIEGNYVATINPDPASVKNCFDLKRP